MCGGFNSPSSISLYRCSKRHAFNFFLLCSSSQGARLDPMHSNKHGCPENQKKYASVALVASDEGRMGFMSCYQHRDYTTEYKNCYGLGHQLQTSLPNYGRDLVSNAGANDTHGAPGLGYGNRHHAYHHYIHKPVQAKEECLVKAPAPRLYRGMPGDYEEKMLQLKKNREGQAILMPAERRWQNSSRE